MSVALAHVKVSNLEFDTTSIARAVVAPLLQNVDEVQENELLSKVGRNFQLIHHLFRMELIHASFRF